MTHWQHSKMVEVQADLILADPPALTAYTSHFEAQLHRGKTSRLLQAGYRWLARTPAGCWPARTALRRPRGQAAE